MVFVYCRKQMKIWAVIKIQRAVRKFITRQRVKVEGRRRNQETKERWRKKLEGANYKPPAPAPAPAHNEIKRKDSIVR